MKEYGSNIQYSMVSTWPNHFKIINSWRMTIFVVLSNSFPFFLIHISFSLSLWCVVCWLALIIFLLPIHFHSFDKKDKRTQVTGISVCFNQKTSNVKFNWKNLLLLHSSRVKDTKKRQQQPDRESEGKKSLEPKKKLDKRM